MSVVKTLRALEARQCSSCPFGFSDAAENAINLGCVPAVFEIMEMKEKSNANWGCHSANEGEKRSCAGFITACLENGFSLEGNHLSYEEWYHKGAPTEDSEVM